MFYIVCVTSSVFELVSLLAYSRRNSAKQYITFVLLICYKSIGCSYSCELQA